MLPPRWYATAVRTTLIVKLVNLLPVPTQTNIVLNDIPTIEGTAELITLTGKPDDKQVKPATGTVRVSNDFDVDLPAYSFTLIRIKQNNTNLTKK